MMEFINQSGIIGTIIQGGVDNIAGNLYVALLIIMLILIVTALMFGIPMEFTALIILPLLLSYMAYFKEWLSTGIVIMLYLTFIVTKRFILK